MEKNNKEKTIVCDCENCQVPAYRSFHRHFFLRWLLGLIILGLVFILGFKLGEFKQMVDDLGFGYQGVGHDYYVERGYPMMNFNPNTTIVPQTGTNTSTKATTTK